MWCSGQSGAGAEHGWSTAWPSTTTTSCPQGGLPRRRIQTQSRYSTVADHSRGSVGDHRFKGYRSVRYSLDAGADLLPPSQPVPVGHSQHNYRRNTTLRRVRRCVAVTRGLGRRKDPKRSCSTAVTETDNRLEPSVPTGSHRLQRHFDCRYTLPFTSSSYLLFLRSYAV